MALGFVAVMALCACGTPMAPKVQIAEQVSGGEAIEGGSTVSTADAAYLFDGDLYLHTSSEDGPIYRTAKASTYSSGREPIVAVEDIAAEQWGINEARGQPVPIFGPSRWHAVLRAVQVLVTPTEPGIGAVMDALGEEELFYYYDEGHTLRTVPIVYKPDAVRVEKTYRLDQVIKSILPQVQHALTEEGEQPPTQALLTTGDDSEAGYPFVFLDFGRKQTLFLRSIRERPQKGPSPLGTTAQAAVHVTLSHARAIYQQPVTSVVRLFTLVTRTTTSLLDPRGMLSSAEGPLPPLNDGPGMDLQEWEATLDRMTSEKTSYGQISYLIDGEQFFPRLIDTVTSAERSVLLRTYIFDNDDYAVHFAELLKRRSNEGVKVRVMVDGLGTIGGAAAQPSHQPASHVEVGSIVKFLRDDSKVKVKVLSNPWLAGDHTKVTIVDEHTAFAGGMNIGREYRYEWHDMMVELTGPVVDYLRDNFEKI
jgi:hypothetical protein